jgi:DNA-binding transcriptional LysR family regulator
MDINKLIQFLPDMATYVTVVDSGSFTKAADKLGITPSDVSQQISRLENALSVVLLKRTTRKHEVSETGWEIYQHCQLMLESAKEAVNFSSSSDIEPTGYLRIAAPKAFGMQVLEPLLASFLTQYPNIKLIVKVTEQFLNPIVDDVDVIFRITDHPTEKLVSKVLGKIDLLLCASPEYLFNNPVPSHPNDLTEHQCLHLGESLSDNQWSFSKNGQVIKVKVSARYAVNHTGMRLSGILQGFGIGVLPNFSARQALQKGDVIQVLEDWQLSGSYQGSINMQYAQVRNMPSRVRVFIDYMTNKIIF